MRFIIYPYKMGSASARALSRTLTENAEGNILRVYPDRTFRSRPDDCIINWGNTNEPNWDYHEMLNKPEAVALAVNKLATFEKLKEADVRTVPWTTDINVARDWGLVCERHALRGHSGMGIRVATGDQLQPAPLYTKMLVPCEEYSVHVFRGEIIDYSKKVKRVNDEIITSNDEMIKNKGAGWEYLRDVAPREGVSIRAIAAVEALGLDFGAVDVIRYKDKSYVLEVGTAAGLSPRGVESYVAKIIEYARQ
mgnify:CR=1 FL=1